MRLPIPELTRCVVALLALCLAACSSVEEKRIRELLNDKGFGTRAQGVATLETYVTGGDAVVFFLEPTQLVQPGFEQLALLTVPQQVGIDGTIHVPYIGSVFVLGLTERELQDLVQEQVQSLYTVEVKLTARIVDRGKAFYVFGEASAKGRIQMVKGDITVLEAVGTLGFTQLANLGRIQLIRPDAQNPLVMEINFREMVLTGNTTYNVLLQDNDILYLPPTLLGTLTRFVEKLLAPLGVVVRTLFGVAAARWSYEVVTDSAVGGGRPFFFGF